MARRFGSLGSKNLPRRDSLMKRNSLKEEKRADSAAVLARWAELAYLQPATSWTAVAALISAVEQESRRAEKRLNELLDQSDRLLRPLGDPLRANVGLHRWLRAEREEAYSD